MKSLRSNKTAIFIFTFPALAIFSLIVIYPLVKTLFMSFYNWDGLMPAKFVYLQNFQQLFTQDSIFHQALFNGILFAVVLTVFQLVLATFLALSLLDKNIHGRGFLRKAYFIPVVLSVTVVCQLWLAMYNPNYGLINQLFKIFGISYRQNWLSSMGLPSIIAIALVSAWQGMGYQLVLIYAGAKSIPEQYFEAAKIDGATTFQTHMKITIPLLAETYKISLIFCLTAGLNAFAHMQIMTKGGPGTATYTLTYLMYRSAFSLNKYGYGCAVAVVLVIQCILVTSVINKFVAHERITY